LARFEAEFNNFTIRSPIGELESAKVSYESWLSEKYHELGRKIQRLDPPGGASFPSREGEGTLIGARFLLPPCLSSHEANLNACS
jgi:hypothetical protein